MANSALQDGHDGNGQDGATPRGETRTETRRARGGSEGVQGGFQELDGQRCYCISRYNHLEPFLMSVVSASDHWMYLSSTGGLTAGRGNPDCSLFPYGNVDQIHDRGGRIGGKTAVLVEQGSEVVLWQPLSQRRGDTAVERRLYKDLCGTAVTFEEENHSVGLRFRACWTTSDQYGFVRRCSLENIGTETRTVRVLDGLHNLVPAGITSQLQREFSSLTDGYKRHELDRATGLALFTLAAQITDRAVPQEQLRATTVWQAGLPDGSWQAVLDPRDSAVFFQGKRPVERDEIRGRRGHYEAFSTFSLPQGQRQEWALIGEVNQSQADVVQLREKLRAGRLGLGDIDSDIAENKQKLWSLVAQSDGIQLGAEEVDNARHFASVLFNIMRGGVFWHPNELDVEDFQSFLRSRNHPRWRTHGRAIYGLGATADPDELWSLARHSGDPDFQRLVLEYLPLTFSRRHGDPSRPWNLFDIRVKDEGGEQRLAYEGNWRDIFQNWEALAVSFPQYLPHMVAKFVNASTLDGHNPYRITSEGIDWERIEPDSPWSNIGYWGDHQVVYLLKLLEALEKHQPGHLLAMMQEPMFSYADVPYRIAEFDDLRQNPRETIRFDEALDKAIARRERPLGTDGRLLLDERDEVVHVNLAEKLLVLTLAKLSNLVPDGGIWLNTQRPEWNDANNALVGYGLSVVTVCHLRRFLCFWRELLPQEGTVKLSREVARWLLAISETLGKIKCDEPDGHSPTDRAALVEELSRASDIYRRQVYSQGVSSGEEVPWEDIRGLIVRAVAALDHTIEQNRRSDGLYHSYNLLNLDGPEGFQVERLYEMLEGQVAVLTSGILSPEKALDLLRALGKSRLFRPDYGTYLLYPDRQLPCFLEKNTIPPERIAKVSLAGRLLSADPQKILVRDEGGACRFHPDMTNAAALTARLGEMRARPGFADVTDQGEAELVDLYEEVFRHRQFTGRSGTMFAFEGLGSIYWHMVSKLLLAVQENIGWAHRAGAAADTISALVRRYSKVRSGLGFNMPPEMYGACPTDPYSHTPADGGARQPGMTGQVKEDILIRLGELGVEASEGRLLFRPRLLSQSDLVSEETTFEYLDLQGQRRTLDLPKGSLAFTLCQVPVVYRQQSGAPSVRVVCAGGEERVFTGNSLDEATSRLVFGRRGELVSIWVDVKLTREPILQSCQ